MPHLPAATNGGPWARVGPVCAAQPGGRGRGRGREPTWAAAAPSQIQRPAHQPSLHCQWHVLSLRREYSGQPNARPRLRRSKSSSTVPRTGHTISASGALASLGLNRMHPVARQRSSVQPVAARAVRSGIVHRWHSVATQCMWLQHSACGCDTFCVLLRHSCVAQRQISRRAAVVTQMWAWAWTRLRCRCGLGRTRADVGWEWTLSQCRGGQGIDPVQLLMWGVDLVPVQMWAGTSPVRW